MKRMIKQKNSPKWKFNDDERLTAPCSHKGMAITNINRAQQLIGQLQTLILPSAPPVIDTWSKLSDTMLKEIMQCFDSVLCRLQASGCTSCPNNSRNTAGSPDNKRRLDQKYTNPQISKRRCTYDHIQQDESSGRREAERCSESLICQDQYDLSSPPPDKLINVRSGHGQFALIQSGSKAAYQQSSQFGFSIPQDHHHHSPPSITTTEELVETKKSIANYDQLFNEQTEMSTTQLLVESYDWDLISWDKIDSIVLNDHIDADHQEFTLGIDEGFPQTGF